MSPITSVLSATHLALEQAQQQQQHSTAPPVENDPMCQQNMQQIYQAFRSNFVIRLLSTCECCRGDGRTDGLSLVELRWRLVLAGASSLTLTH